MLALALGLSATAETVHAQPSEREENLWPFVVRTLPPAGQPSAWTGAGPFLFRKPAADVEGNTARGFRPFWVQVNNPQGEFRAGYFLYPLFSYSVDETTYKWSVFELIRRWDRREGAPPPESSFDPRNEFEVFPFWFSKESGDPDLSYRALFPIHGTIKNKLGIERFSFTLFPFYAQSERRGAVSTWTPWPFLRVTRGAAHGWALWPIYGYTERPGVSRHDTYLWPFGFKSIRQPHPDDPPGTPPRRDVGVLPFYIRNTGPGFINEDFLWPFFGRTDRTSPKPYHERRYFWPLFVQGRGDEKYVNRWAPFYTHSVVKGYDKEWILWPMLRTATWNDDGRIERHRTQFLYFLYWNEQQRIAGRAKSPEASLTHLWPLYSRWDNGAGRQQWQVFSPLEVFFPGNEKIRHAWTPFFALARHERRSEGEARTSLLWNAVTWERQPSDRRSEFHLGPLLGITRRADEQRISIGNGLFGVHRSPHGWRWFWLDFPRKTDTAVPATR